MWTNLLEAAMLICFGISWPLNIIKSYKTRSTKGKSILFLIFVWIGYGIGIANKIQGDNITYVLGFYCLNFTMVFIDICLYFQNRRLDENELSN